MINYNNIQLSKSFDDLTLSQMVKKEIEAQCPKQTFYQKDYLFSLYTKNTDKQTIQIKQQLCSNPTIHYLLNQKIEDDESPFDEKQNDTADILVVKNDFYEIIDIKTRNISKSAQPPNIISAFKLAQVCAKMLDNEEFDNFTINYFEIDWLLNNDKLVCQDTHFACLFKANPEKLYINWAAAMQIQFHVSDLDQSFDGTMKSWAKLYLKHFVTQAKKRADDMIQKFVKPFEKYIK